MDYSIEINNLCKTYKDFSLKNINFSLPKGSIMGFIGENGAGKTTTIKSILNLIKADSGTIKVFGLDHIENEKEIKEQLGVVLDDSFFHDTLRPVDIAKIRAAIYKTFDKNEFQKYIKKFSLPEKKVIKEYSRGMKMKLAIATALAHKPKLLILDEATSGLDPVVRSEILDVFYDFIQDEEHSILLSSHIISDLEKIADYITFIHDGEIVFTKSKDELLYDYGVIKCSNVDFENIDKSDIVAYMKNDFGVDILVQNKNKCKVKYKTMVMDQPNIEAIMLLLIKGVRV